jgi:hypothetical protein
MTVERAEGQHELQTLQARKRIGRPVPLARQQPPEASAASARAATFPSSGITEATGVSGSMPPESRRGNRP